MEDKIRLGGMALANGVLVHGPNSWACAVRTPDGELKVASDYKRLRASTVRSALLPGPAPPARGPASVPAAGRARDNGGERPCGSRGQGVDSPQPARAGAPRRLRLPGAGGARSARLRSCGVSRSRAHLDR